LAGTAEGSQRDPPARISVVICALNEERNLPSVLKHIPSWVDEVVLIDGHSTDRTIEVAKEAYEGIRVLLQAGRGKGQALRQGLKHATGDLVVTLDADGSMDPKEIARFVTPLLEGYDVAKGSRFLHGGGTSDMEGYRKLANRFFTLLTNLLYGTRYTDLAYGYNAFKREALEKMQLVGNGFEIETEINIKAKKAGLEIMEVPSFERRRISGKSHLNSLRDGLRILRTILVERLRG